MLLSQLSWMWNEIIAMLNEKSKSLIKVLEVDLKFDIRTTSPIGSQ